MVSRFIQKQDVSAGDHQFAEHAADLLSSGQDADFLYTVFAGEEHTTQETTDISSIFDLRILGQPVNDGVVVIELFGVILRKIGLGSGNSPFRQKGYGTEWSLQIRCCLQMQLCRHVPE